MIDNTIDSYDEIDKYPTHCDKHNEHKPCQHCRDDAADPRKGE